MKEIIVINPEKINDIAQYLEMGMRCWYHIPTGEVLYAPDRFRNADFDDETWEPIFNEIDEKMHECIPFECLKTHEDFEIMQSFAEYEVHDKQLLAMLITALANRKPFRLFKTIIDNSSYREDWFAYRLKKYMENVQQQLDSYNSNEENEALDDEED